MSEVKRPFVKRIVLRNYKSIRECDVALGPLTLLVGPNGSGKSNFLDALRFVAESVRNSVGHAFDNRNGPENVFSRFGERSEKLEIDLQLNMPDSQTASFRFVLQRRPPLGFVVEEEDCAVHSEGGNTAAYRVREGQVIKATFEPRPPASKDRLYLTVASAFPEFRSLYDLLAGVLFYRIDPERIREEPFVHGGTLRTDGAGAGSVLRRLEKACPELKERIDEYARAILPALDKIWTESTSELARRIGLSNVPVPIEMDKDYLWFVLRAGNQSVRFFATNISDGTLHALGVLLALFQCADQPPERTISLVGIEEPEATLHPAAAGVLFDALHEASHFVQVVATTHSADLLDIKDVDPKSLLIVDMVNGETTIGPADEPTKSIMRDRLATAGELLRDRQLRSATDASGPVGVVTENR